MFIVVAGMKYEVWLSNLRVLFFYKYKNWWPQKQFVEVDSSYLTLSEAVLYRVKICQTRSPHEYADCF